MNGVMRRLKSITSGRPSVSDPAGDSIKRVKIEQEADRWSGGEREAMDRSSTSSELSRPGDNAAGTSAARPEKSEVDQLPKVLHEMKIKDDKSGSQEDSLKDMEPAVISGNWAPNFGFSEIFAERREYLNFRLSLNCWVTVHVGQQTIITVQSAFYCSFFNSLTFSLQLRLRQREYGFYSYK